ncbi:LLM class flavin-dependent oxidoreductase [Actinopolymorpha alba]|uniref:LLM class flavin-dependent oxidoreductase n=1 Tax=Actinopolymorpha alba TaxID=533267 RepID=UPI000371388F|nr:LLM class flavin-dependent oxidoreductase [Actinopolymorpha alba]
MGPPDFPCGTGVSDPARAAAFVARRTERIQLRLAHKPELAPPTFAAQRFAALDRISDGRVSVQLVTPTSTSTSTSTVGRTHEVQLPEEEAHERTREYAQILKLAWTTRTQFDYGGTHYQVNDFASEVFPVRQPRPHLTFSGSSPAAFRTGGAEADGFHLPAAPSRTLAEQIGWVRAAARFAGRSGVPTIQVGFRPILAATEKLAWEKARATLHAVRARKANRGSLERHTLLVGTPETVAAALLDHYDLGATAFLGWGFDLLSDAVEFGRQVIPIVRYEVARREASGARPGATRGTPGADPHAGEAWTTHEAVEHDWLWRRGAAGGGPLARPKLSRRRRSTTSISASRVSRPAVSNVLGDAIDFGRYVIPLVRE